MVKHKKHIALMTALCVIVALLSFTPATVAESSPEQAQEAEQVMPTDGVAAASAVEYTETHTPANIDVTSTPVLAAPIWTSDTVDTLYNGKSFNIIYREYDYYYIQYLASDNVTKRGYISRSATTTVVTTWCQYDEYHAAYNKTSTAQPVYHTFYTGSGISGEIYANEGNTTDTSVILLCTYRGRSLIQYITNVSTAGSTHVKWKRGWVDPDVIQVKNIQSVTNIDGKTQFYLQNVGTGRFLNVPNSNAVDAANMQIWDFQGDPKQKWQLSKIEEENGTYVTVSTCLSSGLVLALKGALAVKNVNIDLAVKGSTPSKDQQFYIKEAPGYPGEYIFYSRLTGTYLQMGVFHDNTGNGGVVAARYPYVTQYNRWRLIPVGGSSTVNGVKILYDSTCTKTVDQIKNDFTVATSTIEENFGVKFHILAIQSTSLLNGSSCPNTANDEICSSACGADSTCGTSHHKSGDRLCDIALSNDFYTLRVVGHTMCNFTPAEENESNVDKHGLVYGTAYVKGVNSIVSTTSTYFRNTIQHELSHNLGASHKTCIKGFCTLNGHISNWCAVCRENIEDYIGG